MRYSLLMLTLALTALILAGAGQAPATSPSSSVPTGSGQEVSPAIAAFMKPIDIAPGDDALRQKLKERHNTAVRLLALRVDAHRKGITDAQSVFDAARVVAEAKMDLAQNDDERRAVLEQVLQVSKDVEARLERQFQAGVGSAATLEQARLARQTAEIQLLKLKRPETAPATQPS